MEEVFKLFGTIGLDTKEVDKGLSNISKKLENTAKTLEKAGKKMSLMITTPIVAMMSGFAAAAMDLEASEAKYNTVFAGMTDQADAFIKKFQQLTPATTAEARNMASGIQDLLIPMGFAREEATAMTGDMFHLIGALTNFNSGTHSAQDVANAFSSALTGSTESLKRLGIQVTQESIKQKALEMGLIGVNDELDNQSKAQALMALAYEQSGDALTGYTEANLDVKTKMGLLKSEVVDISAKLGEALLPAISAVVNWLREGVTWFASLSEEQRNTILMVMGVVAALGPMALILSKVITLGLGVSSAISGITLALKGQALAAGASKVAIVAYNVVKGIMTATTWLATTAMSAFGAIMAFVTSPIGLVVLAIGALIAIGVLLYKNWDVVKEKAGLVWEFLKNTFDNIKNFIGNTVNAINSTVTSVFNKIKDAIMNPIRIAVDFVKDMIDRIKDFFNFKWELPKLKMPKVTISGKFSLLPPEAPKFKIDWFAKGGIMSSPTIFGMNGNNLMGGGEAGKEAILPLNRDTLGKIGEGIVGASGLQDQRLSGKIDALLDLLVELLMSDPKYQVVLDSGVLAGELVPLIDERMGRRAERKLRGG